MNEADLALLTSFTEGSPQFIKEALACGTPIVSTDVGDVKEQLYGVPNSIITSFDPVEISRAIEKILNSDLHHRSSHLKNEYDNQVIANKLLKIYYKIYFRSGR